MKNREREKRGVWACVNSYPKNSNIPYIPSAPRDLTVPPSGMCFTGLQRWVLGECDSAKRMPKSKIKITIAVGSHSDDMLGLSEWWVNFRLLSAFELQKCFNGFWWHIKIKANPKISIGKKNCLKIKKNIAWKFSIFPNISRVD